MKSEEKSQETFTRERKNQNCNSLWSFGWLVIRVDDLGNSYLSVEITALGEQHVDYHCAGMYSIRRRQHSVCGFPATSLASISKK